MIIVVVVIIVIAMIIVIVVIVVITMIIVIVVLVVTAMIIMVVVIIVIAMIVVIVVLVNMDLAIEVLRFSPNQRRSNGSLNGQTATRAQTPLEDSTEQSIKGVMLGFVVQILFKASMTLESHNRSKFKFTRLGYISTATMGAMGKGWPGLNQRQKK
jgi:hypothetical protein